LAEAGVNFILMSLSPIGFGFHVQGLMIFGVIYYPVLFAIELIIWWIPYLSTPTGRWRNFYNWLLASATSNFEKGDTLNLWVEICHRLHGGTISPFHFRDDRPVPNLEHTLHAWTLLTAIVTAIAYFQFY
jgi:hypothetical protein